MLKNQELCNTSLGAVHLNDYTQYPNNPISSNWDDQLQSYTYLGSLEEIKRYSNISEQTEVKPAIKTKEKEKKMSIPKGKRGLFQVILVDPKAKKTLLNEMVIADSLEDVLLEVDAGKIIKDAGLSVSDVDKIVNIIGIIRKTRKNKTGELEIVNEEEAK